MEYECDHLALIIMNVRERSEQTAGLCCDVTASVCRRSRRSNIS